MPPPPLACPDCRQGLVVRTRKPLAWRECPACGGRWFGAGVLINLIQDMIVAGEVERVARHAKGNPRLDALARGFVTEFKALDRAEAELRMLAELLTPWPPI